MKTQVQEVVFSAGLLAEERSERSEKYSQQYNIKLHFIEESADSFESACREECGESTENCPRQTGTEIYQARTHRSSPSSWEEGCRQDKAYPCEVYVEKDETGWDQEQMKAKQFRPRSSHC